MELSEILFLFLGKKFKNISLCLSCPSCCLNSKTSRDSFLSSSSNFTIFWRYLSSYFRKSSMRTTYVGMVMMKCWSKVEKNCNKRSYHTFSGINTFHPLSDNSTCTNLAKWLTWRSREITCSSRMNSSSEGKCTNYFYSENNSSKSRGTTRKTEPPTNSYQLHQSQLI